MRPIIIAAVLFLVAIIVAGTIGVLAGAHDIWKGLIIISAAYVVVFGGVTTALLIEKKVIENVLRR
jgi:ABC-type lipopolysaccharide export system ATPase subunit